MNLTHLTGTDLFDCLKLNNIKVPTGFMESVV